MFNVRLANDRLYVKLLFTWLSLVMSLMVSFWCCSFSHKMSWMRSGTELCHATYFFVSILFKNLQKRLRRLAPA